MSAGCRNEGQPSTQNYRSHLATTTPQKLATEWATELGVSVSDICQYFRDAGYVLD